MKCDRPEMNLGGHSVFCIRSYNPSLASARSLEFRNSTVIVSHAVESLFKLLSYKTDFILPLFVKNPSRNIFKFRTIQLVFTDYALDFLAEQGFDPQFGARPLKRLIQKEIVNQLSKRILAGDIDKSHPVLVDVFDNTVVFRNEALEAELAKSNGKKK